MSNVNKSSKGNKNRSQQEQAARARAKARAKALEQEQEFYAEQDSEDEFDFIDDLVAEEKVMKVTFQYLGRTVTATHIESLPYEYLSIAAREESSGSELGGVRLINYFLDNALTDSDRGFFMQKSPKAVNGLFEKWSRVCSAQKKG